MPNNFAPADPLNPYADYGFDRLTQFLSGYTLTRDVGAQYEYSNLGGGLLETLLARRAVGYDRSASSGVVVLSNTFTPVGVDDIGMHLLDSTVPLWAPPVPQVPKGID